jgi:hypothetical protein
MLSSRSQSNSCIPLLQPRLSAKLKSGGEVIDLKAPGAAVQPFARSDGLEFDADFRDGLPTITTH